MPSIFPQPDSSDINKLLPLHNDMALASLAVLEQYSKGEGDLGETLLKNVSDRELCIGLLAISQHLLTFIARATPATEAAVIGHLRQMYLDLANSTNQPPNDR